MKLQTHICNACGNKGETYTLTSIEEHLFNMCPGCVAFHLQKVLGKMSLIEISDLLKKGY